MLSWHVQTRIDWLCWDLMTHQPLWVILCHLPEKGRKEIEEIVRRWKRGIEKKDKREWNGKKTEEIKRFPSTLTCCPTVSQYQLDTPLTKGTDTFATPDHPHANREGRYQVHIQAVWSGFCHPLTEWFVTEDYTGNHQRAWSNRMNVQADLGTSCSYMSQRSFSYDATHSNCFV